MTKKIIAIAIIILVFTASAGIAYASESTDENLTINGTFRFSTSPTAGYVLTSTDGLGNAGWAASGIPTGTTNNSTIRYNGTSWVENTAFTVTSAGTVSIAAGQSYTGLGAVTLTAGAGTALTITSPIAATWSTTAGNLTLNTPASLYLGSAATDALIVTTDGTGDAEVVLPNDSISTAEILDNTVSATDLAATLTFADGDFIDLSSINMSSATEGLRIGQATSCASATAEGQICWDIDDDDLYLGNGSTAAIAAAPKVVSVVDTTSDAVNTTNAVILDNGATTYLAITPTAATHEVLVMYTVNCDSGDNNDHRFAWEVRRTTNGTVPTCASTLVGAAQSVEFTDAWHAGSSSAAFIDAPATTNQVRYTICGNQLVDGGADGATPFITLTLMEIN